MHPTVCICCGGRILGRSGNPNLCMDCERLMEDDSPMRAAEAAAAEDEKPKARLRLPPEQVHPWNRYFRHLSTFSAPPSTKEEGG